MAPSSTKVIVAHVTSAKAAHVTSAKASHVTAAKAAHAGSAKAAHVTAAKATHMAATATATHMASTATATATAAGLGTRGNKAAGKQCTCQNHHRSSSHDILQLVGRTFRHRPCLTLALFSKVNANVAMDWRWRWLFFFSTKFFVNQPTNARSLEPIRRTRELIECCSR